MAETYDSLNSYNSNSTAYVGYINSLSLYESSDQYENSSYTYDAWLIYWDTPNSGYDSNNRTYDGALISSGSDSASGTSSAAGSVVVVATVQLISDSELTTLATLVVKAVANLDITLNSIATINQFIPGQGTGSGIGSSTSEGSEYTLAFNSWNDSYYSVTFNSDGYKFLGLDATPATGAQVAIFLESDLTATAYEIQYPSSSIQIESNAVITAIEIQKAIISISGLSVTAILALEQVLARSQIEIQSSLTASTSKDAYSLAQIDIESNIQISPIEIQFSAISIEVESSTIIDGTEILYAQIDPLSIESQAQSDTTRVRVVSASLSVEASVNVGSYKFARALIDSLVDAQLTAITYKDAYALASLSGDCSLSPSAVEIQYGHVQIDCESNTVVNAIEIVFASCEIVPLEAQDIIWNSPTINYQSSDVTYDGTATSQGMQSNVTTTAYEIQHAIIDLQIDGYSLALAEEILYPAITVFGSVDVVAVSKKDAYANAEINVESQLSVTAIEIQYAQIDAISSESNVSATAIEILLAATSTLGESDLTATAYEIQLAVADWQVEGYVLTLAQEILYPEITISGTSDLNATAYKIAHSQAESSIESEVVTVTMKDAYAKHESQIDSDVIATAIEILYAQAVLDGTAFNVTVGKEILLAKITIGIESAFLALMPTRFSDNIVEDTQIIRTLVLIDNKPITEQTRSLASYILQPNIQNSNWKNARNRYYKSSSGRRGFSLSWTMIPNSREQTVDLKFARDLINQIGSDPDTHTIKILNMDSSGTTPYTQDEYNVIVKNYSESLIRRDLVGGEYWWNCNLELEEV